MRRSAWKRHASIAALCAAPMLMASPGLALAQAKGGKPPKGPPAPPPAAAAAPAPAAPAAAPAGDPKAVATALFLKGSDLFKAKKFALALEQFKQSYAAVPSPNSHLYIARCLAAMGETRSAYVEYTKVVDEATLRAQTEEKYVPTRDSAKTERDELAPKLGMVTITVNNPDPASTVRLGSVAVPPDQWGKPFPVDPGTVDAVVQTGDKPPVKQTITVGAGERRAVTLDAVAAGPAVVDNTPKPKTRMSPMRLGAFASAGVGVVGLIMFTAGGVTSQATYSSLKSKCGGDTGGCHGLNVSDDVSRGKTQQGVANAGIVLGILGIGAGATLFVLSARAKPAADAAPKPSAEVVVGPSWAGVQGAF
jgi:hypothetical protein